jgi:hypothetical protein
MVRLAAQAVVAAGVAALAQQIQQAAAQAEAMGLHLLPG